ncbi:hypothetical protein AgCh_021839 [Apium graveolens]
MALLSQFEEKAVPLVTFEDNNKGFTMGYGKLISRNVVIDDVALVAEECTFISKKTGEVALKGARKGSLFVADLDSANEDEICCFYTKASVEQSKLWHKKLSHLNFKAVNTLVKKELLRDIPSLEFAQDESISRKRYALVMLDDYSRYTWVEFMYSKNETPHIIIEHIKKIEKQTEDQNCVKRLRSDNGIEFMNSTLTEFSKDKGIVQEFSAARTPQQNGVVERNNKTLVEATRTILQDVKLPTIEALKFENLNIDSDSNDEAEVNTTHRINEESTEQVNHENGSSSHEPEFDSTNSGGEREEGSASHANGEENTENSSQQTHTRK